ncbi:MAG: hypothetical protein KF743_14125, partial [Fimbriimonadaceae bacterium]|nr:hypothetical protein [Fimbriimonadaceae bacterium]
MGNEPPRLIPFAHLVVQMRNRAYMPQLGRFLQPDPNATALTLIEATAYHGRGLGAMVGALDIQVLYGIGLNIYEYLGSSPCVRHDPLGLEWLTPPINWYEQTGKPFRDMPFDITAATDVSGLVTSALQGLVIQYAANLEADLDWASDWDAPDNAHSRLSDKWVKLAILEGIGSHFGVDWMWEGDESGDPIDGENGPAVAKAGGSATKSLSRLAPGLSRQLYQLRRKTFKANRMKYWRTEIADNPQKYSPAQKAAVKQNRAPTGSDGKPMEIHHRKLLKDGGTNDQDNFEFLTFFEHRSKRNLNRRHKRRPRQFGIYYANNRRRHRTHAPTSRDHDPPRRKPRRHQGVRRLH